MTMPSRRAALLSVLHVACAVAVLVAASRPAGHRALPYLAAHAALAAVMLVAWRSFARSSPVDLRAALVAGVASRAVLAFAPVFTSTDVGRYLWDGAVALHGYDPYALPPLARELAALRLSFPAPVDHLDVATCYPPLALALFAASSAFGAAGALAAWKALTFAASSLTAWIVWRALRDTERPHDALLALWSPALMLEAGVGAHLDAFTTLAVVAALVSATRGRWGLAALGAGVAGALKLVPGLVVIPLVMRAPRKVWFLALAAAPFALSMGAATALGLTPPGSLPVVAENWSFAAPLWTLLYGWFPVDDGLVRAGLAAAGMLAIVAVSLRRGGAARNVRDALGVSLATSPVLYPWYGLPTAGVVAFAPSAWAIALLVALPCSYEVLDAYQAAGVWAPARWPVALNAAAMLAGVAVDVALWRRRARAV